jgi:hypothetical protein
VRQPQDRKQQVVPCGVGPQLSEHRDRRGREGGWEVLPARGYLYTRRERTVVLHRPGPCEVRPVGWGFMVSLGCSMPGTDLPRLARTSMSPTRRHTVPAAEGDFQVVVHIGLHIGVSAPELIPGTPAATAHPGHLPAGALRVPVAEDQGEHGCHVHFEP